MQKLGDRKKILRLVETLKGPAGDEAEEKEREAAPPRKPVPRGRRETRRGIIQVKSIPPGKRAPTARHKSLMMIGETGCGKTTLINSMMNFLFGVQFADPFRYKLIVEKDKGTQAVSMTDEVNTYYIEPPALDFGLTLIDTPGYGDTRGLQQDKEITKKIKAAFEERIQDINAICFVMNASRPRLTPTQRYIFKQILGIFGHDVAQNIIILLTFADATHPPALAAVKEAQIPYTHYFKLNNSAFFLDGAASATPGDRMMANLFWDVGVDSFCKFFAQLAVMPAQSLTLTKTVLREREQLETSVENLQPVITIGLNTLENIRQEIKAIEQHKVEIDANKSFTVTKELPHVRREYDIPAGRNTTTCLTCNYTCHQSCVYADNTEKADCSAMSGGYCTQCPERCHWTMHKNLPYRCVWTTRTQVQTLDALKARFVTANSKLSTSEQIMQGKLEEFMAKQRAVFATIQRVKDAINRLNQIALCANVFESSEYFDVMIESEEAARKPLWQDRVKALKKLKQNQETLAGITQKGYNPWAAYKDVEEGLSKHGPAGAGKAAQCHVM